MRSYCTPQVPMETSDTSSYDPNDDSSASESSEDSDATSNEESSNGSFVVVEETVKNTRQQNLTAMNEASADAASGSTDCADVEVFTETKNEAGGGRGIDLGEKCDVTQAEELAKTDDLHQQLKSGLKALSGRMQLTTDATQQLFEESDVVSDLSTLTLDDHSVNEVRNSGSSNAEGLKSVNTGGRGQESEWTGTVAKHPVPLTTQMTQAVTSTGRSNYNPNIDSSASSASTSPEVEQKEFSIGSVDLRDIAEDLRDKMKEPPIVSSTTAMVEEDEGCCGSDENVSLQMPNQPMSISDEKLPANQVKEESRCVQKFPGKKSASGSLCKATEKTEDFTTATGKDDLGDYTSSCFGNSRNPFHRVEGKTDGSGLSSRTVQQERKTSLSLRDRLKRRKLESSERSHQENHDSEAPEATTQETSNLRVSHRGSEAGLAPNTEDLRPEKVVPEQQKSTQATALPVSEIKKSSSLRKKYEQRKKAEASYATDRPAEALFQSEAKAYFPAKSPVPELPQGVVEKALNQKKTLLNAKSAEVVTQRTSADPGVSIIRPGKLSYIGSESALEAESSASKPVPVSERASESSTVRFQEAVSPLPSNPDQAVDIYNNAAKTYFSKATPKRMAIDTGDVFIGYCRGRLEAANEEFSEEQIPDEVMEAATNAFAELKRYVDQVEDLFHRSICLPPGQFKQRVSARSVPPLDHLSPEYKGILASRLTEFATEYEKRNAVIVKQEEEVMRAMISVAGTYFEEEALESMGSSYFEATPLADHLKLIEDDTRQNFLNACDLKVDTWKKKFLDSLNEEIVSRRSRIQEKNEQKRMKTQSEIKEIVEETVRNYASKFHEQRRHKNWSWRPAAQLRQLHQKTKQDVMTSIDAVFLQKYKSCPGLHDSAKKEFEIRIEDIFNEEFKKTYKHDEAAAASNAKSSGDSTRSRQTYSSVTAGRAQSGPQTRSNSGKASSTPAFNDLPSSAIAIHLGLHHTRVGLFKPGSTEFKLLAEVDNCLYYRNNRVLLPFSFEEKMDLGPPDLTLGGIIIDEPVDKNYYIAIDAEELRLRKEHLLSLFLFLLKSKSELELKMKLPNCVVVVPQFLNLSQRGCIFNAASIAGFTDVKFLDDTAAIALEHMMRVGEKERDVIVASALESDVIDIASFKLKNRAVRWVGVSGKHFIKGDNASGILSLLWGMGRWWSSPGADGIIGKIFNHNELGIGKDRLQNDLKLLAGDDGLLSSIVASLEKARNFAFVGELNPLRGGAYLAELFHGSRHSPLFKAWEQLETSPRYGQSFDQFREEILSTQAKEKKRSSNYSTGAQMSVPEVGDARRKRILKERVEVHTVAMNAMKVLVTIGEVVKRNEIKDKNAARALSEQLPEYFAALRNSNLTLERAKQLHDQLIDIWHGQVQGPRSSTR